ncbi:MAG TPA: hypothetical protein VK196_02880 [Magnetospirillum sp.]|nr:hypothetical protein [Magnetospirillum sp.]
MNKLLAAAAAILALSAVSAQAEDLQFTLINRSAVNMDSFQVSHSGTKNWEENLFPANAILPAGNELTINIRDGLKTCEYDIRSTFVNGQVFEDYSLDLCKMNSYTFN